ncbi:BglG family transcription antiterminator [Peribacillus kribbensis]|uniref:BglG family transcription antiterminator n=1 Tax=Peribacillus kribbensis TaxID=356658 RepID=UPI00041F1A5D|nr:BglG family transcription antiterminator [Peribacillus kribbensis]
MLNSRTTSILRELLKAETFLTSEYLAQVLTVTSRTIRSDIKELEATIENYGVSIKSIRGTGYQLEVHDDHIFRKLLKDFLDEENDKYNEIPIWPEDRVRFIIRRLLLADGYCKIDEIADELFISRSTLLKDLKNVKSILLQYGIKLDKRPNFGLKTIGDEFKHRLCISDHLFGKFRDELELAQTDLPIHIKEDLNFIREVVVNQLNEININLSDIGLNNLSIHIAIAYHRIKSGNYVTLHSNEMLEFKKVKQYQVAEKIVNELERKSNVRFPEQEAAYITIHLLGTKIITERHFYESIVPGFMGIQIESVVKKILHVIDEELHLGIKEDKELFAAICLHLKPAIHRFHYGINLPNPLLEDIKSNYHIAYQAAVIAGTILKQELKIDINENEMGYLAIHIGAAIENTKGTEQAKRCLIVCASGMGSARLLASKIRSKFRDKIDIVGTTDYYKLNLVSLHDIDFIISTIHIPIDLPIPVIQVHTILGGGDFERIEMILTRADMQKIPFIKEELVFLQQGFETSDEVLAYLCKQLQALCLVNENFLESVRAREQLSSTSYGNFVAIPHPVTPQTETTFWAVCTLKKPIDWGGKRVQFICLLSVEKNSINDLQNMYDYLVEMIDDSQIMQQLLKCKTYKEFEAVFSSKYKNVSMQ